MIAPHATGHVWAQDGTLLRVDCEPGAGWVATRYDRNLRVIEQVRGSDAEVHHAEACWVLRERYSDSGTATTPARCGCASALTSSNSSR